MYPTQGGYPQGGYPQQVYPQGGFPATGASPHQGSYPPSGAFPQAGYPAPVAYPQGGHPVPDGLPQEHYPAPVASPQGGYPPPAGFTKVGGYPPPPHPNIQPGYPGEGYNIPPDGYVANLGEDDDIKGFDFTEKSIRRAFIRKVYAILMAQLTVTLGFISLFTFHEPTKWWVMENTYTLWIALILVFACIIAMACCEGVRRKAPGNFIFLSVFTIAESFLLGVVSSRYESTAVMMAVGITAVICLALTVFAMQTRFDFTVMGGALFCVLVVLVMFGFIMIFIPKNTIMTLVYASVGALLFSLYLIYDTQMMMGGNHKYTISPEEYIFAALNLYLDVINIFLYILRIIGAARG